MSGTVTLEAGAAPPSPAVRAMPGEPLGVAVVGLGFMGRTHLAAWRRAAVDGYPVRVRAVHDRAGPVRHAGGNLDTGAEEDSIAAEADALAGGPPTFEADLETLLARKDVDVVSLCTPTDTHVPLAERILDSGRHVLIEKPVAIRAEEVRRLADLAAARPAQLVMPAMCIRFWPGWAELRRAVADGRHGLLRSLHLVRQGSPPDWNPGFYRDPARSGGVIFDLHVHDADMIHACLGRPRAVTATGSPEHLSTVYHFGDGAVTEVLASGSWALPPSAGFRMRYLAVFEHAALEYDLAADPPLRRHDAEGTTAVAVAGGTGYDGQVRHLSSVLAARRSGDAEATADPTLAEAASVTAMLEAEAESIARGRTVELAAD
ncbi:MAG: Gfo/Idh/MocA family protein [Planctomycetota bacterium]